MSPAYKKALYCYLFIFLLQVSVNFYFLYLLRFGQGQSNQGLEELDLVPGTGTTSLGRQVRLRRDVKNQVKYDFLANQVDLYQRTDFPSLAQAVSDLKKQQSSFSSLPSVTSVHVCIASFQYEGALGTGGIGTAFAHLANVLISSNDPLFNVTVFIPSLPAAELVERFRQERIHLVSLSGPRMIGSWPIKGSYDKVPPVIPHRKPLPLYEIFQDMLIFSWG